MPIYLSLNHSFFSHNYRYQIIRKKTEKNAVHILILCSNVCAVAIYIYILSAKFFFAMMRKFKKNSKKIHTKITQTKMKTKKHRLYRFVKT